MSILAPQKPPLVHANGRRLRNGASRLAQIQGAVSAAARQDRKEAAERDAGYPQKRAKLMLTAKANLHITEDCPRQGFFLLDPETMTAAERADAEAAGVNSRTLVLHPEDLDRAIEHFSAPENERAN